MKLAHMRAIVAAALSGAIEGAHYTADPVFGIEVPAAVPGVPTEVLTARSTWAIRRPYDVHKQVSFFLEVTLLARLVA